jgi:hypothetical protein
MAVLYRPIKNTYKDKYEIVDYEPTEEMQDLMKFAPLDVAISSSFFLSNLGIELLKAIPPYLKKEMKTMTKDLTNSPNDTSLEKIGVGIQASMHSLQTTLQSLTLLQDINLLNVSPILVSSSRKTKSKQENLNNK